MRRKIWFFLLCFLLNACTYGQNNASQSIAQKKAQLALTQFLEKLADGEYADAVELYGGSYEELRDMNPLVPENDLHSLWKNGCQLNGFQCLPLLRVIDVQEIKPEAFLFTVELDDGSGKTYEQGSCCGGSDDQRKTHFDFRVIHSDGGFLVCDMPPYLP